MYASTKISQDLTGVKTTHILLIRSIFTTIAAYIYGKVDGVNFGYEAQSKLPQSCISSLVKRSVFGYAEMLCLFLSITLMPVSVASSIMQATAFVTSIMAYFLKGEPLSSTEIVVILFGLLGCMMLTNTQWFVDESQTNDRNLDEKNKYPYYVVGLIFAISFTICSALKFLAMSELGNMVHSSVKTYWFGVFSTAVTVIYLMFTEPTLYFFWNMGSAYYPMTSDQFLGAFIIGFFSWAG
jgi:drug/metabolite transporter (DMT)-like permease